MENNIKKNQDFQLLQKIPKDTMQSLLDSYLVYSNKYKYLRYFIGLLFVIILGYNFFVAGKQFTLEKLNNIQTIFGSVLVLLLIGIIYFGIIMYKKLRGLKSEINKAAVQQKLDKKLVRKQFHSWVKSVVGGPGLR